MAARKPPAAEIEPRIFQTTEEIDSAIAKLERRIKEIVDIDFATAERHHPARILEGRENGRRQVLGIINGLIARLKEKREDLDGGGRPASSSYFDKLILHPRIADVARDLFVDGHHFEAVFAAAKALVNYVKERSGRHDLDGAPLMRTVFSKNAPVLAFNDLSDQTDFDEQEGTMHLFEGAVLAIRNPGGHAFPEGSEQRAIEYISLLSLLAYRVQEAKKAPRP
jgi:uncharacterized protein (TIGR02391 family)